MALTSFTLRKTTSGYGSTLRNASTTDTSLRADGVIGAGTLAISTENTLSANVLYSDTIRLLWTLSEPLEYESNVIGGSVSAPVALVIVSSTTGEPVTIEDGSIVTTINADTPSNTFDDTPSTLPGRWVYYALFIKYQLDTDYWYERGATLYIQLPTQYNSTDMLWSHIPSYYQGLDEQQGTLSQGYTPLYSFLELFGNEVDRTRTLIDSVAIANDPNISVTPALEQLAIQTGLEIGVTELGTTKARALLNNIGTLRQRKGTMGSIISYISGMSGCGASYEYASGEALPHIFHVTAQRVNFVSDPTFYEVATTTTTSTVGSYSRTVTVTPTWGVVTHSSAALPGSNPKITVTNYPEGIVITMGAGWGSNVNTVQVYPQNPFPYDATQTYYCSYDTAASAGASFNGIHLMTNTNATLLDSSTPPSTFFNTSKYIDDGWDNTSVMPTDSPSRRVFEYAPNSGASFSVTSCVPMLEFNMIGGSSVYIGRWLWEPSFVGNYFDGDTRNGGYIPSTSGVAGEGLFDYFWGDGGAHSDYSYYLLDRQRTIETTERVLSQYVVPVTMVNEYEVDWHYYTGK